MTTMIKEAMTVLKAEEEVKDLSILTITSSIHSVMDSTTAKTTKIQNIDKNLMIYLKEATALKDTQCRKFHRLLTILKMTCSRQKESKGMMISKKFKQSLNKLTKKLSLKKI